MRGIFTLVSTLIVIVLIACAITTAGPKTAAADDQVAAPKITVFDAAQFAIAKGKLQKTPMVGFSIIKRPFQEIPRQGGLLVGFDVGLGSSLKPQEVIYALRPVYRTKKSQIYYRGFGRFKDKRDGKGLRSRTKVQRIVRVRAKLGYAVASVMLSKSHHLNGMKLTFMRIDGVRLDPQTSYSTGWIGSEAGKKHLLIGGEPIVGVYGNIVNDSVMALGLVHLERIVVTPAVEPANRTGPTNQRVAKSSRPKPGTSNSHRSTAADSLAAKTKQSTTSEEKPVAKGQAAKPPSADDIAQAENSKHFAAWAAAIVVGAVGVMAAVVAFIAFGRDKSPLESALESGFEAGGVNVATMDAQSAAANVLNGGAISSPSSPPTSAQPPMTAGAYDAAPTYFTAVAAFTWSRNRIFRIYTAPDHLLFIDAGPYQAKGTVGVAALVGGLIGGLAAAAIAHADGKTVEKRGRLLDQANWQQLQRAAEQDPMSFRANLGDLLDVHIGRKSFWTTLSAGNHRYVAALRFRRPGGRKYLMQLLTGDDLMLAIDHLPKAALGQVHVNVD